MDQYLIEVAVDGQPAMLVDMLGQTRWLDFETLRSFCERFLTPSRLESLRAGPVTEVRSRTSLYLNLISVGTGDGSRSSVMVGFGREDRGARETD